MNQSYPSQKALTLQRQFRDDPHGQSHIDLKNLLEAWGVTKELTDACAPGYRVCIHPDAPQVPFGYPERDELSRGTVLWICDTLEELRRCLA